MMCCVDGGMWLLPTALLPGVLHRLHMSSPDPVLCASCSCIEVSAALGVSLGWVQWQEQERG